MNEKELLEKLIKKSKQPNVSEWVYEIENFLNINGELNKEAKDLIEGIKFQGDKFNRCENLVALLKQLYKKKYDKVVLSPITKHNQFFIAMMFSQETNILVQ